MSTALVLNPEPLDVAAELDFYFDMVYLIEQLEPLGREIEDFLAELEVCKASARGKLYRHVRAFGVVHDEARPQMKSIVAGRWQLIADCSEFGSRAGAIYPVLLENGRSQDACSY